MSQFLASSFARALLDQIFGFGGEAHQQPVALLAAQFGQDIRRGIEFQREPRGGLLHLLRGHLREMEIRHRRGFHDDAGSLRCSNTASRISRAVCTWITVSRAAAASCTGPEISITCAPRAAAASASA